MPTYEFRCHDCAQTFDVQRPMSASADPAPCPDGHRNTVKLLSTIALTGAAGGEGARMPAGGGGGCCGGACGCG
ncbi:zinc ribbon domain-containing protein [Actinophytocola sp.]|uniref:zinc ribbon domain-containing protein n=1 Tax=Actinophytocola sp. TaxID=1872138 RepID=UPI002EDB3826